MTTVRTLKRGDTVDERVLLEASAVSPDPTANDAGINLQGAGYLHLYADFGGGITAATITPWYFSTIAGDWFEGDPINLTAASKFALVEVQGEERLFLVLDALTGAGTLKVWGGYSYDSPGRDP